MPARPLPPRRLALLMLAALLPASFAQGNPFAALEVVAAGPQSYDVATGITTLQDGGRISDHDTGVTLTGNFVRFREGDFVEVQHARVQGDFGSIQAPTIRLDIPKETLTASGDVQFDGSDLSLRADALTLFLQPQIAVATGAVQGADPPLDAGAMVVDLSGHRALLVGPYRYQNGPLTLRGTTPRDLLSLRWVAPPKPDGPPAFQASTEPTPELLAKLQPYLP